MRVQVNETTIELVQGDITQQDTEAIVNAANSGLLGGGGVDGAIHRAGGSQIMAECRRIGGCPTGEARITSGGKLRARHIIHAVGPIYRGGNSGEEALLASAHRHSLELAAERGDSSIAFPAISTGAYGYPMDLAARIAVGVAIDYARQHSDIDLIRFVLFSPQAYRAYEQALIKAMAS